MADDSLFCEVCGRQQPQGKVDASNSLPSSNSMIVFVFLALIILSIFGGMWCASLSSKNKGDNTYWGNAISNSEEVTGLGSLATSNLFLAVGLSTYDWWMSNMNYKKTMNDIGHDFDLSIEDRRKAMDQARLYRNKQKGEAIGNTVGALLLGGVLSCMPGSAIGTWIGGAIVEKWYGSSIY